MDSNMLKIDGLYKSFGKKEIIKDFSLEISSGEIVGLVGQNGAGKTTIMKMLTSLIKPTKGTAYICGKNIKTDYKDAMRNVGAIIETPKFYKYMTGFQNMMQYARLYRISKERVIEVFKIVGLESRMHDRVQKYSLGMKQRLGIAQAILHKPKLLILDEPTNSLDTAAVLELRAYLKNIIEKEKCSILISSHILSEMEKLCTKIAIIQDGKLLEIRNTEMSIQDEVKNTEKLSVSFSIVNNKSIDLILEENPYTKDYKHKNNIITFNVPTMMIPKINAYLAGKGIEIFEIKSEALSLESIFMHVTGGNKDEKIG